MDKRYIISTFFNTPNFDVNEIFKIIIENNIDYSSNSNGIFINLSLIDDSIIDSIYYKLINLNKSTVISEVKKQIINSDITKDTNENFIKDKIKLTSVDKLLLNLSRQTLTI